MNYPVRSQILQQGFTENALYTFLFIPRRWCIRHILSPRGACGERTRGHGEIVELILKFMIKRSTVGHGCSDSRVERKKCGTIKQRRPCFPPKSRNCARPLVVSLKQVSPVSRRAGPLPPFANQSHAGNKHPRYRAQKVDLRMKGGDRWRRYTVRGWVPARKSLSEWSYVDGEGRGRTG